MLIVGPLRVVSGTSGIEVPLSTVLLKSRTMGFEVNEVDFSDSFTAVRSRKFAFEPVVKPVAKVFEPDVMFKVNPAGSEKSLLKTVPAFAVEMAISRAARASPAAVTTEDRNEVERVDMKNFLSGSDPEMTVSRLIGGGFGTNEQSGEGLTKMVRRVSLPADGPGPQDKPVGLAGKSDR